MKKLILILCFCLMTSVCFAQPVAIGLSKAVEIDNIGVDNDKVVIGDELSTTKFKPQAKMVKWNGEESLTIRYDKVGFDSFTNVGGKIRSTFKDETVEFYQDGKDFKFIIYIAKKPLTNILNYKLTGWENFNFFYQPPLTQNFKDEGHFRPDDVVGSYAVYHKIKKNYVVGQTNYKTGKAFHIYRPKFIDADGKTVWADLNIDNENYTITIPQNFLDTAKYPIKANDTFGYTSIGGTNDSGGGNGDIEALGPYSPASNGDATSISIYFYNDRYGTGCLGIYDDDGSGEPDNLLGDTSDFSINTTGWVLESLDSSVAVTTGTDYWLAINSSAGAYIRYDTASDTRWQVSDVYVPGSLTDPYPGGGSSYSTIEYSLYATYTPGEAPAEPDRRILMISKKDKE